MVMPEQRRPKPPITADLAADLAEMSPEHQAIVARIRDLPDIEPLPGWQERGERAFARWRAEQARRRRKR